MATDETEKVIEMPEDYVTKGEFGQFAERIERHIEHIDEKCGDIKEEVKKALETMGENKEIINENCSEISLIKSGIAQAEKYGDKKAMNIKWMIAISVTLTGILVGLVSNLSEIVKFFK